MGDSGKIHFPSSFKIQLSYLETYKIKILNDLQPPPFPDFLRSTLYALDSSGFLYTEVGSRTLSQQ